MVELPTYQEDAASRRVSHRNSRPLVAASAPAAQIAGKRPVVVFQPSDRVGKRRKKRAVASTRPVAIVPRPVRRFGYRFLLAVRFVSGSSPAQGRHGWQADDPQHEDHRLGDPCR
jgi:hypothetical protein